MYDCGEQNIKTVVRKIKSNDVVIAGNVCVQILCLKIFIITTNFHIWVKRLR